MCFAKRTAQRKKKRPRRVSNDGPRVSFALSLRDAHGGLIALGAERLPWLAKGSLLIGHDWVVWIEDKQPRVFSVSSQVTRQLDVDAESLLGIGAAYAALHKAPKLCVVDLNESRVVHSVDWELEGKTACVITPQAAFVADTNSIYRFPLPGGDVVCVQRSTGKQVTDAEMLGDALCLGEAGGVLRIYDGRTLEEQTQLDAKRFRVVEEGGILLATHDKCVALWVDGEFTTRSPKCKKEVGLLTAKGGKCGWSAGDLAFVATGDDFSRPSEMNGHSGKVIAMDIDDSCRWLLTAAEDGTARVWEIDSGRQVALWKTAAAPATCIWTGDGSCAIGDEEGNVDWLTLEPLPVGSNAGAGDRLGRAG